MSALPDALDYIVELVLKDERCAIGNAASVRKMCNPYDLTPTGEVIAAVLATALISLAPMIVLPLLPPVDSEMGRKTQPVLLCFAAGGMLGDVFLHI